MSLHAGFIESCRRFPDRAAVTEPGGPPLTYRDLGTLTDQVRDALLRAGVAAGDRVGMYLPKTVDSVAVILGALKAGAAYVPVDPGSPAARAAYVLSNCSVRIVITTRALAGALTAEFTATGATPQIVALDVVGNGKGVSAWIASLGTLAPGSTAYPDAESPAYLLYTSGSTGQPKGVVVSHRASVSFVHWCIDTFGPTELDRFSSHAPFHFDLSIHDLYASLGSGGCVVLIDDELSKDPKRLADLIDAEQISIWYSTPSILSLLEEHGRLDRHQCRSLRIVLFAGEVFPIPRLRRIMQRWTWPRFANLYGPTETNVCTWYGVPGLPEEGADPLPIGIACAHYQAMVLADDSPAATGERGELLMAGPGVMTGYWNLPERNANAFWTDAGGVKWYRTGDLVSVGADGIFRFHGRRDRMVKRRGYRIELGEIESGIARHPAIASVTALAKADDTSGVTICAFLEPRGADRPSIVELKRFCTQALPRYMIPDRFMFVESMPQTSTDKTDYQALAKLL